MSIEIISDEEYYEKMNNISATIAGTGYCFVDKKNSLFKQTLEVLKKHDDESICRRALFDVIFYEQLAAYIDGAEFIVNSFNSMFQSDESVVKSDIDGVMNEAVDSKEQLIEACIALCDVILDFKADDDYNSLFTGGELNSRLDDAFGVYYETSFVLGLTDAKSLNYFHNKGEKDTSKKVSEALANIFPNIS